MPGYKQDRILRNSSVSPRIDSAHCEMMNNMLVLKVRDLRLTINIIKTGRIIKAP